MTSVHSFKADFTHRLALLELSDYKQAKEDSSRLDAWIRGRLESLPETSFESSAHLNIGAGQSWDHLDPEQYQTPFVELRLLLAHLLHLSLIKKGTRVLDVGAGTGRLLWVGGVLAPEAQFLGVERVSTRVAYGKSVLSALGLDPALLTLGDVCVATSLPEADLYFCFDFSDVLELRIFLETLKDRARTKPITLITRGGGLERLIYREALWLSRDDSLGSDRFSWKVFRS